MIEPSVQEVGLPAWLARIGIAFALMLSLSGALSSTISLLADHGRDAGESFSYFGTTSSLRAPWIEIEALRPDGPAAKAGLRPGDAIRFHHLMGEFIGWRPGERVTIDVARGSARQQLTLVAEHSRARVVGMKAIRVAMSIEPVIILALCIFVLVRGWRLRRALLLTAILVSRYMDVPTPFLPHGVAAALLVAVSPVILLAAPLWLVFCLEISGGWENRRSRLTVTWLAAFVAAENAWVLAGTFLPFPLPVPGEFPSLIVDTLIQVTGFAILALNYRHAHPAIRNRIKIVALAFACLLVQSMFFAFAMNLLTGGEVTLGQLAPTAIAISMLGYAAAAVLVYAVVSQRLFDVSFAINRTLVYGAVSFTLLAAFGVAEWGADRLVPEAWHKGSSVYSASIAVLLFLSFHRLRDWFEKHIERLFFSGWQKAEAALRRFVASAGHFEQPEALCRGFHDALAAFAGAKAAVYLREGAVGYRRQCGALAGAPEEYADDEPAFALMRAERAPVELPQAGDALPGALALPMLDRATLTGFVLLGAKRDGAHYRPDEVDNLGWATQQVGLDLQALQARELREEVAILREQLTARRRRPPKLASISAAASA